MSDKQDNEELIGSILEMRRNSFLYIYGAGKYIFLKFCVNDF